MSFVDSVADDSIEVYGAREHNLKNIDVSIPRNSLVVMTGLSGSGKSSLAFDTIYAEGQRRYIESFSAYARQFLGNLERPDVDRITGLSPVISIEQKTTGKNPRSTVGTITEIYDFMRLLFARAGTAYSWVSGEKMVRYTEQQILHLIPEHFNGKRIALLAPVVKGRKGHYRDLFEQIRKSGFSKVRIDGNILDISFGMKVDRYKVHDIEIVIDRVEVEKAHQQRITESLKLAFRHGKGNIIIQDLESGDTKHFSKFLMCPVSGISYDEPAPNLFSFNSPYGACQKCNGLGEIIQIDLKKIIPDPSKTIRKGGISPLGEHKNNWIFAQVEAIADKYGFSLDDEISTIDEAGINAILYGTEEILKIKNPVYSSGGYAIQFTGIVNFIAEQHEEGKTTSTRSWAENYMNHAVCPDCQGTRLKKESLWFRIAGENIARLASLDIASLSSWFEQLEDKLEQRQRTIGHEVIKEIRTRIGFLMNMGLDYLTLNRGAGTLSGGESQRIRLATQIGSGLTGVLYILDEPSIGLHQRDNVKLIKALQELRDSGNSIIVVEHDKDMIMAADYVIDIGPGAGINGGAIVSQGSPLQLQGSQSTTARYLRNELQITVPVERRTGNGKKLVLQGASGNNLKEVDLTIPLGTFVCITGVSGSGKSSLINETLYPVLNKYFFRALKKPLPYKSIKGLEHLDKVIEVDQSPIGRTPRSNPATYTGVFTDIRNLFANMPEAEIRGYKPGRFSFNVKGGRCETCHGGGMQLIEMNFLPDVYVQCPSCHGKRYNRETLEVRYRGKSIGEVLDLTIDQAVQFFENIPTILQKIKTLQDVGLGYVSLGQSSTTLSGGEAQRVKLATELSKKDTGSTLYILDEPTTGLHFEDIRILLEVLQKLINRGNTVLIIEHNLDIIKVADYIVDMGPEGGERGGQIIATGSPEEIAKTDIGFTAEFLKKELALTAITKTIS
ncbi:MAG: excinuclease ABC subunit UvrA [Bacteroidia bacterium]|nr:excinuclease ABC subunit UvrA [Bacteroidia bacterium]MCC6767447.1 excinuclease ABC subunit UvrA [Bacteroidia bacterium]